MPKNLAMVLLLVAVFGLAWVNIENNPKPSYDELETKNDQLWCRAEIDNQLAEIEDTSNISIDDIMFTYQVCVDNIDEFPTNAFGATTP